MSEEKKAIKETHITKLGYQAYCDLKDLNPPYPKDSKEYDEWVAGWIEAKHDFGGVS